MQVRQGGWGSGTPKSSVHWVPAESAHTSLLLTASSLVVKWAPNGWDLVVVFSIFIVNLLEPPSRRSQVPARGRDPDLADAARRLYGAFGANRRIVAKADSATWGEIIIVGAGGAVGERAHQLVVDRLELGGEVGAERLSLGDRLLDLHGRSPSASVAEVAGSGARPG